MGDALIGLMLCGVLAAAAPVMLLPAILQVAGTVDQDEWFVSKCLDPYGSNTNNGATKCASTLAEVSQAANALEIASCVLVTFAMICWGASLCIDNGHTSTVLIRIGFVFCPLAGILSIAGCSVFASELVKGKQYDKSFSLCLAGGILMEIYTMIGCCYRAWINHNNNDNEHTLLAKK